MISRKEQHPLKWVRYGSRDGIAEVRLSGFIDLSTADALGSLEAQLYDDAEIVMDVADVDFVDTTFLRFLLRLRRMPFADRERNITLVGTNPHLVRVLEVTGLSRIFSYIRPRA